MKLKNIKKNNKINIGIIVLLIILFFSFKSSISWCVNDNSSVRTRSVDFFLVGESYAAETNTITIPDGSTYEKDKEKSLISGKSWWNKLWDFIGDYFKSKVLAGAVDIVKIIGWIIGALAGLILRIESFFLEKILVLNHEVGDAIFVKVGWKYVRDLADLFFGIVLILIGISTIIGYEKFSVKKLLPTLIILALVINFSFMVCVFFIDLGNVFIDYFYNSMSSGGNWHGVGDLLAFKSGFFEIEKGLSSDSMNNLTASGMVSVAISAVLFNSFLAFTLVLVIGAVVVLFFIRFAALAMLIILAPIAWVFMLVPTDLSQRDVFSEWLSSFIKWIIFGPAMMFFIWLAIFIGSSPELSSLTAGAEEGDKFISASKMALNVLGGAVTTMIFLIGGLKISTKFGIHGAEKINGWVDKKRAQAQGFAKRTAAWPVKYTGKTMGRVAKKAGSSIYETGLEKVSNSRIPVLNRMALKKSIQRDQRKAEIAKEQVEFLSRYNKGQLEQMARSGIRSFPGFDTQGPLSFKTAMQAALMKKGSVLQSGQISEKSIIEIKKYLPDLIGRYPMFTGKPASDVVKNMSASQAQNIALVDMIKDSIMPNHNITGETRKTINNWMDDFFKNIHQTSTSAFAGMVTNASQDVSVLQEFAKKYKEAIASKLGKSLSDLTGLDIRDYLKIHNPGHLDWLDSNTAKNLGVRDMFLGYMERSVKS